MSGHPPFLMNPQPLHSRHRLDPTPDTDRFNYPGPGSYNAPSQFDVPKVRGPRKMKKQTRHPRYETPGPGNIPELPAKKQFSMRGTWAQGARFDYRDKQYDIDAAGRRHDELVSPATGRGGTRRTGTGTMTASADGGSTGSPRGGIPPLASLSGSIGMPAGLTGSGAKGVNNMANSCFRRPLKDKWDLGRDPFGHNLSISAELRNLEHPNACTSARCRLRTDRRNRSHRYRYRDLDSTDVDAQCTFGSPFKPVLNKNPGPGAYPLPEARKPGAKFLKGERRLDLTRAAAGQSLSPCDYSPDFKCVHARVPRAVLYMTS